MTSTAANILFDKFLLLSPSGDDFADITLDVTTRDDAVARELLLLPNAYVAVGAGEILYAGTDKEVAIECFSGAAYQVYDGKNKILLPAFANTHGHLPMTLMRNQAEDRNLHEWLFKLIFPMEARLTAEHVYYGSLLALAEMIRSGTGAAADMYYFSDQVAKAAVESGFRLNVCCDGKEEDLAGKTHVIMPELTRFKEEWLTKSNGLIIPALLVHSIYLYEPYLYEELANAAHELDLFIQVHISETIKEVEECQAKYGLSPPQQLDKFGLLSDRTIAAHCVHLDDSDRALLARRQVSVAHNPASNMKLGSGFADVGAMLAAGINVSFGTDGAASNNNLDLYQEIRLAGYLAKGSTQDASNLKTSTIIRMASYNGMQALGFKQSGSIQPGFKADLQIVNYNEIELCPLGDPAAALVYSANGSHVESLMIDGKWLLYKKELKTIDQERVMAKAKHFAATLSD